MYKLVPGILLAAAIAAPPLHAETPASSPAQVQPDNEELLLSSLRHLRENRVDSALQDLRTLTSQQPDFRLAQLIYADLMAARGAPLTDVGRNRAIDDKQLYGLISEAKARLLIEKEKPAPDMVPASMIQLAPSQKYAIVMDTRLRRLFVFENVMGVPKLIKDYYASYGRGGVGKERQGDLKTPLGVYFVTGRFLDRQLPDRYGTGALPLNYPNRWDERLGRTGNGIWVHGSPFETYSRPPEASEGCISLSNVDFTELDGLVDIRNTPVLVGFNVRWMKRSDWLAQQSSYRELVERWRVDWESLDSERYLSHYSADYKNGSWDYKRFSSHKRRVNAGKKYINVDVDQLSLFTYPDQPDLMVATFRQSYKSSNYKGDSMKRQYWVLGDDGWKIAYEGEPGKGKP
ncbi:L,D-transpeptidase family protein [Pontibacterium granulatum]|uniref:L,D-transpeptidase family protein n=1 Tax=Pontibacterium granulatum TaxID=2036029 RepID=UPI00249B0DF1|nr:L,D-transpeptidase family protein [Pontibacterium granulatum]MDI3323139.1 L,D-transpeptidase family protein [Pontibacterium granulatum]